MARPASIDPNTCRALTTASASAIQMASPTHGPPGAGAGAPAGAAAAVAAAGGAAAAAGGEFQGSSSMPHSLTEAHPHRQDAPARVDATPSWQDPDVVRAVSSRRCPPPPAPRGPMPSTAFAAVARAVNDAARAEGLEGAAFRSPPSLDGTPRSVRRLGPDTVLVAVVRRGRSAAEVTADMVDGVLRANPGASDRAGVRDRLLAAAHAELEQHSEPAAEVEIAPASPAPGQAV